MRAYKTSIQSREVSYRIVLIRVKIRVRYVPRKLSSPESMQFHTWRGLPQTLASTGYPWAWSILTTTTFYYQKKRVYPEAREREAVRVDAARD